MASLKVVARLVDGGEQDLYAPPDLLRKLAAFEKQGLTGKHLVHALFTDDWGAPPQMIVITGSDSSGRRIHRVLEYD
jgi:hypothetical protein